MCGGPKFFGGMFDFNGDGKTDAMEQALGFAIMEEMDRELKKDRDASFGLFDDLDDEDDEDDEDD